MMRELAAARRITDKEAMTAIEEQLAKAPKRGSKTDVEIETDDVEEQAA